MNKRKKHMHPRVLDFTVYCDNVPEPTIQRSKLRVEMPIDKSYKLIRSEILDELLTPFHPQLLPFISHINIGHTDNAYKMLINDKELQCALSTLPFDIQFHVLLRILKRTHINPKEHEPKGNLIPFSLSLITQSSVLFDLQHVHLQELHDYKKSNKSKDTINKIKIRLQAVERQIAALETNKKRMLAEATNSQPIKKNTQTISSTASIISAIGSSGTNENALLPKTLYLPPISLTDPELITTLDIDDLLKLDAKLAEDGDTFEFLPKFHF